MIDWKQRWAADSTIAVSNMMHRIELTLTWLDLDSLVTDGVYVPPERRTGVWRVFNRPAVEGVRRQVRQSAANALRVAAMRPDAQVDVFSPENVRAAKKIVRDAIYAYALPAST